MKKQTVYITGGSSGIGLALAEHYVRQGADLLLLARNQNRLDKAAATCRKFIRSADQRIETLSVDVSRAEEMQVALGQAKRTIGTPDILILSAGTGVCKRFVDQTDEDFEQVIATNLGGCRRMVKALLPDMLAAGTGHIVFVASMAGLLSAYGYTAYCASKFALVGMGGALRQELAGSGVNVSVVCPPEVDTPMVANDADSILPQTRLLKDTTGTLQVDVVTRRIVRAIDKNQRLAIPGFKANVSYALVRWFPGLIDRVLGFLLDRVAVDKKDRPIAKTTE